MTERRVAIVPIYKDKYSRDARLVLVTSRGAGEWILPTGKKEKNRTDRTVAEMEAFEEAGVVGDLKKCSRSHMRIRRHSGRYQKLHLYLLRVSKVLKRWPECKQRERAFVQVKHLDRYIEDKKLRAFLVRQLENQR